MPGNVDITKEDLTTFKRLDGEDIYGEFSWVTDDGFFDDLDEPLYVVKETWVRASTEVVRYAPPWWDDRDDPDLDEADDHECAWCPHAKTGEGLG